MVLAWLQVGQRFWAVGQAVAGAASACALHSDRICPSSMRAARSLAFTSNQSLSVLQGAHGPSRLCLLNQSHTRARSAMRQHAR